MGNQIGMYIQSGRIKANKKDIEDIKTFLHHAQVDINYGWEGSYGGYPEDDTSEAKLAQKELESGLRGKENIVFLLEALCDKWK